MRPINQLIGVAFFCLEKTRTGPGVVLKTEPVCQSSRYRIYVLESTRQLDADGVATRVATNVFDTIRMQSDV